MKYGLNIPKMKTSFSGFRSVQVKSIKDWNNITDKIHFTATEDLNVNALRLPKI